MKILCIGDSLGLPRKGCDYEETWLALLRQHYPEHTFFGHFAGDRLVNSALNDYNQYFQYYNPDVVILQQGICDCAPRYVDESKLMTRVIRKFFYTLGLKNYYWHLVKSHKRNPNCVKTRPEKFVETCESLINKVLSIGGRLIFIKIGHGAESVLSASPFFNDNVDRYNALLDQFSNKYNNVYVVDPLNNVKEEMFVDGYHCGPSGMLVVYEALHPVLDKIITGTLS